MQLHFEVIPGVLDSEENAKSLHDIFEKGGGLRELLDVIETGAIYVLYILERQEEMRMDLVDVFIELFGDDFDGVDLEIELVLLVVDEPLLVDHDFPDRIQLTSLLLQLPSVILHLWHQIHNLHLQFIGHLLHFLHSLQTLLYPQHSLLHSRYSLSIKSPAHFYQIAHIPLARTIFPLLLYASPILILAQTDHRTSQLL